MRAPRAGRAATVFADARQAEFDQRWLPGEGQRIGLARLQSVAMGAAKVTTAPLGLAAITVWSPGHALKTGGVVSATVTSKLHWALPHPFWAVQVTVLRPIANAVPEPTFIPAGRPW